MGSFNNILIKFKNKEEPSFFLEEFQKRLKEIGITFEKSGSYLIFNDLIDESEKDPIEVSDSINDKDVIKLLISWKGLGLISYRNKNVDYPFHINYLSWNNKDLEGIQISFKTSNKNYNNKNMIKDSVVMKIAKLINFEFIIGSIGDSESDFNISDISEIMHYMKNRKFDIDIRTAS
jgi:hypothetical protein